MEAPRALLRIGDSGPEVVELQQLLFDHGVDSGSTDGHFGPKTRNAVVRFQSMMGVAADGIVGPETWARLRGHREDSAARDDLDSAGEAAQQLRQQRPPFAESLGKENLEPEKFEAAMNRQQRGLDRDPESAKEDFSQAAQGGSGEGLESEERASKREEGAAAGQRAAADESVARGDTSPGLEASISRAALRQAGYRGEKDEERRDLLDFRADVNALSQVVASRNVDPPLSIGLFGDWGVGKSFFMHKMKKRIRALADSALEAEKARAAGRPVEEPEYWSDIAQIDFNAWHYVDKNLWASLVVRVFDGLAQHISGQAEVEIERPEEVFAAKQAQLRRQEQLLAEKRSELDAVRRWMRETDPPRAPLLAWLEIVATDGELRQAIERSGLAAHLENVAVLNRYATDMVTRWGRIRSHLNALFTGPHRWRLLGIGVGISALGLGVGWLPDLIGSPSDWPLLERIASWAQIPTWVIGAAGTLLHYGRKVNGGLTWFEKKLDTLRRRRDEMQKQLEAAWAAEQQRAVILLSDEKQLLEEIAEAHGRIEEIRREFAALEVDTNMLRFVEERAVAAEYREQLGIVAAIRRDFEQLSRMLTRASSRRRSLWKLPAAEYAAAMSELDEVEAAEGDAAISGDASTAGETRATSIAATTSTPSSTAATHSAPGPSEPARPNRLRRIDRIVLYVDDLDRCPPERVVEVLQAVHLLLYFELFVVVVAVDSRWLLLSLEKHYPDFLKLDRELAGDGGQQLERGASTPQNYLEKIFQIALNIPRMDETGFGNLVDVLLAPAEERVAAAAAEAAQPGGAKTSTAEVVGERDGAAASPKGATAEGAKGKARAAGTDATAATALPGEAGAGPNAETEEPPIEVNPPHLQIADHERRFLKSLHALIDTPRAVNRLTNTYRLLRATLRERELTEFETEGATGYRAVLLLLALLIGRPYLARFLLRALDQQGDADVPWPNVAGSLEPTRSVTLEADDTRKSVLLNSVCHRILLADVERWQVLGEILRRIPKTDDLTVGDMRPWVRRIARYAVHPLRFERPDELEMDAAPQRRWSAARQAGDATEAAKAAAAPDEAPAPERGESDLS